MKKSISLFMLAMLAVLGMKAQMIAYTVTTNVVGEPGEPTVIDLQDKEGVDLSGLMIDAEGNTDMIFNLSVEE